MPQTLTAPSTSSDLSDSGFTASSALSSMGPKLRHGTSGMEIGVDVEPLKARTMPPPTAYSEAATETPTGAGGPGSARRDRKLP